MSKDYKKLRRVFAVSATTAMVVAAFAPVASAATDVSKDSQYYNAVSFLKNKGVKGYTDGTFKPHQQISRVQAAEMLVKVLGLDTKAAPASGFKDVTERAVPYVNALKAAGITKGKTAERFGSNDLITRGELAIWIEEAFDLNNAGKQLPFKDVTGIYTEAVKSLVENGVTLGKTETSFGTAASATRGEFALFLHRAHNVSIVAIVNTAGELKADLELSPSGNKDLVYGPESGTRTIDGNLVINGDSSGTITLQNIVVKGNLIVNTPDASVVVDATTKVEGTTYIQNVLSNTFTNKGTLANVVIEDNDGTRFINSKDAVLGQLIVNTTGNVTLGGSIPAVVVEQAANLKLEDASSITALEIKKEVKVEVPASAVIEKIQADAPVELNGQGKVSVISGSKANEVKGDNGSINDAINKGTETTLPPSVEETTPKPENFTLSLMHTNDTHANLDNVAKRVTAVKEVRAKKPNAVLVDAGDVFSGTLYFNQFKGQADLEFMNIMGYDVMTLGNHEFDLGSDSEGNKALADFIKAAKFPLVSSNVDFSKDPALQGLFSDLISSEPENGKIYNGIVKEINGEKVGFFGLTTAETKDIASPGPVTFEDYLAEAEKAVKAFENMGVNKIVAVTHIGYDDNAAIDNDLELAAKVDGIDVIVGGHSHTQLSTPVAVTKDEKGAEKDATLIVQAYQYNEYLGTLDVEFDAKGKIVNYDGKLLKVADYAEDEKAAEALKKYSDEIKEVRSTETGATAEIELKNPRLSDKDNDGTSVRANETALGNLITDGMLEKAKQYNKNVIMAMQNGGGIRAAIDKGPITVGEVINVLPFGNTLATMTLTGAELKEAFEISFKEYPKENGGFLHVSGAKVVFDSTQAAGKRVVSIFYKNADEYVEIQDKETYTIATNAFTAKGGDGYDVFKKAYEEGRVTDLGLSDWENLRDHVISLKNVAPKVEGRIVDKPAPPLQLTISEIQGASHKSPYEGKKVSEVEGIVTYVDGANKFYMQSENPDSDVKTSDGIEIYMKNHGVKVGDVVAVSGKVTEYRSSSRTNDLTTTQIEGTDIKTLETGHALPKAVVLDDDRNIPTDSIDDDGLTSFDPETDAIDFYESLEGMLVQVNQPKIVSPVSYNDLIVVPGTTETMNNFGGLNITATDYNPERLTLNLNDENLQADAGDYINGNVTGTIGYDYGNYVIQTKSNTLPEIVKSGKKVMEDVTTIAPDESKLTVASYNIENFAVGDDRVADIAKSIVKNLNSPDIVQLSEVQDDSGSEDDGTVSAAQSYQAIIDEIKKAGGPEYAYTEVAPEDKKDGGAPGGNIRVGIIYNKDRVSLKEGTVGSVNEAVAYKDGNLTLNPGRIDPTNEAFTESRKPFAAQFTFKKTGEDVIVIAAHYNSKSGDHQLFGDVQPPVLSSEEQRNKIAKVVNDFVADIHEKNPNANVIVAGDLNDFEFSRPLEITAGTVLTNMIDKVPAEDRFTYFYQGNSQVLDHILVSNHLVKTAKVDIVHINSPFTAQISDHDPVLVQLDLTANKQEMSISDFEVIEDIENLTLTFKGKLNNAPEGATVAIEYIGGSYSDGLGISKVDEAGNFSITATGFNSLTSFAYSVFAIDNNQEHIFSEEELRYYINAEFAVKEAKNNLVSLYTNQEMKVLKEDLTESDFESAEYSISLIPDKYESDRVKLMEDFNKAKELWEAATE